LIAQEIVMYLLTQLWLFLGTALLIGAATGYVLRQVMLRRRMQAVQHGAYREQQGHRAEMSRLANEQEQTLRAQAQALQYTLEEAYDHAWSERLETWEHLHNAELDTIQQQSRRELAALVRAHDEVQAEARLALQRALGELAVQSSAHASSQAELVQLQAELSQLRQQLVDTLARHEQALAATVAQAQDQARVQLEAQSQAYEQVLLAQREALDAAQQEQSGQTHRLQAEAAKLREQLDVMLIELSAAARARDAREAQRAQLAQQLAIETAARAREAEIAGSQRAQLRERLISLQQDVAVQQQSLQTQCDALAVELLRSRRSTQAAVLAARQREARMEAELSSLRQQLLAAGQPVGATVHELVRVA
jgi:hypothetical protein